jgi:hypothetical protein
MMTEAVQTYEMSVHFHETKKHQMQDGCHLHTCFHENLKSKPQEKRQIGRPRHGQNTEINIRETGHEDMSRTVSGWVPKVMVINLLSSIMTGK